MSAIENCMLTSRYRLIINCINRRCLIENSGLFLQLTYSMQESHDTSFTYPIILTINYHLKDIWNVSVFIVGFISTVLRLFRNGCFTFSILGSCLQMFFVSGMISFMPKFLETQFTIPTWHANLLMGKFIWLNTNWITIFSPRLMLKYCFLFSEKLLFGIVKRIKI